MGYFAEIDWTTAEVGLMHLTQVEVSIEIPLPSRNGSGRLFSLWDLMNAFRCKQFALSLIELKEMQRICHQAVETGQAGSVAPEELRTRAVEEFEKLVQLCEDSGFEAARASIRFGQGRIIQSGTRVLMPSLMTELQSAEHMVMSDMWKCRFYLVPKHKSSYLDAEALFGEEVKKQFPSAEADIREGGNCLAMDRGAVRPRYSI